MKKSSKTEVAVVWFVLLLLLSACNISETSESFYKEEFFVGIQTLVSAVASVGYGSTAGWTLTFDDGLVYACEWDKLSYKDRPKTFHVGLVYEIYSKPDGNTRVRLVR